MKMNAERLASELNRLYREVDQRVRPLLAIHSELLQCRRGCCQCCIDDLTVFEVEAENVRRHYADLLLKAAPHPEGACAFLDQAGACRIYEHRPYVCRTQGLPVRWAEERDGQPVEVRDICPVNAHIAVTPLPPEACWTIGPIEQRIAALEGGARVPLRSLFAPGSAG